MNIVTLIESYGIEVKQQGQLYVCFCPFHADKNTPNLYIYPKTNSWYCFACNHGGDALQFIALKENKSRDEVKKSYVDDFITDNLESFGRGDQKIVNCRETMHLIMSKICREFLQTHRDKIDEVLSVLKSVDAELDIIEVLDPITYTRLVDKLKKNMYTI